MTTPCKPLLKNNYLCKQFDQKKAKKKPRKQKNYREWKEKCAKKELFCVFALSKQKILPGLNARTWLVCMFFNFLLSFIWPTVELLVHNRMHKFLLSFLTTMHNEGDSMRVIWWWKQQFSFAKTNCERKSQDAKHTSSKLRMGVNIIFYGANLSLFFVGRRLWDWGFSFTILLRWYKQ